MKLGELLDALDNLREFRQEMTAEQNKYRPYDTESYLELKHQLDELENMEIANDQGQTEKWLSKIGDEMSEDLIKARALLTEAHDALVRSHEGRKWSVADLALRDKLNAFINEAK